MARRRSKKRALEESLSMFRAGEEARRGIEEMWLEAYKAYRGVDESLRKRQKDNKSGLFVPKIFSRVETATATIVNSILSERPYAMAYPRGMPDGLGYEQAASMTALVDFQLAEVIKLRGILTKLIRNAFIYGIAPAQIGWERVVRNVKKPLRGTFTDDIVGEKAQEEVIYDAPVIVPFDPFSFVWDEYATSVDDASYVAVWSLRNARWLQDNKDTFSTRNVNKALETTRPENLPGWFSQKREIMGWRDSALKNMYEIIEVWTPDGVTTICNRQEILRDEPNPFWHGHIPFATVVDNQLEGEFAGLGMVLPALDLQVEVNAKRNQRMDNVNLTLNPPLKYLRGTRLSEEDVQVAPGKLIPMDGFDDIQPFEIANVTGSAYQEEDYIVRDINETMGIHPYQMGASPEHGRERATTVVALQSAGGTGLKLRTDLIEENFLLPVVRQIASLNQQFLEPETAIRITDDVGLATILTLDRDLIDGEYYFSWTGSTLDSVGERQFKVNQLINLLGVLDRVEGVNMVEYVRKILHLVGLRGVDRIIPNIQPAGEEMLADMMGMEGIAGNVQPNQELPGGHDSLRMGATPFELGGM